MLQPETFLTPFQTQNNGHCLDNTIEDGHEGQKKAKTR